jgi:hypothetical protein
MISFIEIFCNSVTDSNNGAGVVAPDTNNGWHVCMSPKV